MHRASQCERSRFIFPVTVAALAASALPPVCTVALAAEGAQDRAPDSFYCRKVRAQAAGDAALLVWPKVILEAIRFPSASRLDLGPTLGNGFQGRAAIAFSPMDMYRSVRLERVAEADCRMQEVAERLRELVVEAANDRTLPALLAQSHYLETHRTEWRKYLAQGQERLKAGVITMVELQDLRRFVGLLERKVETVAGEVKKLEANMARRPWADVGTLTKQYTQLALDLEKRTIELRALDAWGLKVLGGTVLPTLEHSGDWYGMVEVSYNLGGFSRTRHDARALSARESELRQARYELSSRAEDVARFAKEQVFQAQHELGVVESELSQLAGTRNALVKSDVAGVEHARATLAVEQFSLESDRIFLKTLIESLSVLTKKEKHGSLGKL